VEEALLAAAGRRSRPSACVRSDSVLIDEKVTFRGPLAREGSVKSEPPASVARADSSGDLELSALGSRS